MAISGRDVLSVKMQKNDGEAATIRDYLVGLVRTLWAEGEGFSGKRPFGNSAWECELHLALVNAKLIEGEVDRDGYLQHCDEEKAHDLINVAINALGESR